MPVANPQLDFLVPHIGKLMNVPESAPRKGLTELNGTPIMWKSNDPIKAALRFVRFFVARTGGSMQAILKNTENGLDRRYYCKCKDFEKLIKSTPAIAGVFVTEWRFRRSGRNIYILEA